MAAPKNLVFVKNCADCLQQYVVSVIENGEKKRMYSIPYVEKKYAKDTWDVKESDCVRSDKRGRGTCRTCLNNSRPKKRHIIRNAALPDQKYNCLPGMDRNPDATIRLFDCHTSFGRHCLPPNDEMWCEAEYVDDMAHIAQQYSPYVYLKDLPRSFTNSLTKLYGRKVEIVNISASASDANMFYLTLATEMVNRRHGGRKKLTLEGHVLVLEGCYVAGKGPMQSLTSREWLQSRTANIQLKKYMVSAPWGYEYEEEISSSRYNDVLTELEQKCLSNTEQL
jgi:hypothetical protein